MSALKQIKKRVKELEKNSDMLDLSAINIGTITPEIRKEMEKCKNISCLNLQECALESLDNLPNWKIQVLDLSENK
ncbi:MAG: hypothetical protein KDK61_08645 [Simkania sp.]|nr:hypothetical protein [Simkania sp.]